MKELIKIEIMKQMDGFEDFNNFVLKETSVYKVNGEAKLKDYKLDGIQSEIKFFDDITKFILTGSGVLREKGFLGKEKETKVDFELNTMQGTFATNYEKKEKLLPLLILFYFDFLKQFAKEARK